MMLNNVTSSVMGGWSRDDSEEAIWQQGLWHIEKKAGILSSLNIVRTFKATIT